MKIHYLQHVPFEDLGSMHAYFEKKNAHITCTRTYENQIFPKPDQFDWLIIMGGPMGVYDEEKHPWLISEKEFIKAAIASNKIVLGICLGAQLIADVLGANITQNKCKEIGWFDLKETQSNKSNILKDTFKSSPLAFHWHGDTFSLPAGALHLAKSNACENQAFSLDEQVFGFQFHLETTQQGALALIKECADELVTGNDDQAYIQTADKILNNPDQFKRANLTMARILNEISCFHELD